MGWSINLLRFLSCRKCVSVLIVLSLNHESQRCGSCEQTHFSQHSWASGSPAASPAQALGSHVLQYPGLYPQLGQRSLGDFRDCVCGLIYDPQVCCVVALFFPRQGNSASNISVLFISSLNFTLKLFSSLSPSS